MNLDTISAQECIEKYQFEGQSAILNDGKLVGFQPKEIPTQTANPSGDK